MEQSGLNADIDGLESVSNKAPAKYFEKIEHQIELMTKKGEFDLQQYLDSFNPDNEAQESEEQAEKMVEENLEILVKRKGVANLELDEEMKGVVKNDLKDNLKLINEIKNMILMLRTKMVEILRKADEYEQKHGRYAVDGSLSLINVRVEALVEFCRFLMLLTIMKINGDQIENHPIVKRLIFIKTFLNRLRPINKKIEYQIGKMLRLSKKSRIDIERERLEKVNDADLKADLDGFDLDDDNDENEDNNDNEDDSDVEDLSSLDEDVLAKSGKDPEADKEDDPKKLRFMTKRLENFSENDLNGARNRLQRGAPKTKEQKNLERFLEYKKGEVLRSGLVQEMQNELEERPIEMGKRANIAGVYDPMEERRKKFEEENMTARFMTKDIKKKINKRVQRLKDNNRIDNFREIKQLSEYAQGVYDDPTQFDLKNKGKRGKGRGIFGDNDGDDYVYGSRINKKKGFGGVQESFDVMSRKKGKFKVARKGGRGKKKGRGRRRGK